MLSPTPAPGEQGRASEAAGRERGDNDHGYEYELVGTRGETPWACQQLWDATPLPFRAFRLFRGLKSSAGTMQLGGKWRRSRFFRRPGSERGVPHCGITSERRRHCGRRSSRKDRSNCIVPAQGQFPPPPRSLRLRAKPAERRSPVAVPFRRRTTLAAPILPRERGIHSASRLSSPTGRFSPQSSQRTQSSSLMNCARHFSSRLLRVLRASA